MRAAAFADACRINALSSIMEAGSGHIGTSFSVLDILALAAPRGARGRRRLLLLQGPRRARRVRRAGRHRPDRVRPPAPPAAPRRPARPPRHRGRAGRADEHRLARHGRLEGQGLRPRRATPGRAAGACSCITGDGELQEGQFWESLGQAANEGFGEITVIVDHNKIQSDTWVDQVSDLGDLEAKGAAFGWATARCDGNDVAAVARHARRAAGQRAGPAEAARRRHRQGRGRDGVRAARPRRARGTALYPYHSGAPAAGPVRGGAGGDPRPAARPARPRRRAARRRTRRAGSRRPRRRSCSPRTARRSPRRRPPSRGSWRSTPTSISTAA